jgi:hypothetical protein
MTRRELAGLVCVRFKWTPGTFWAATPHEVVAMIEASEVLGHGPD